MNRKHGLSRTSVHYAWMQMRYRCTNPNHGQYADYGGRGVTVCDRWFNSFDLFLEDMGPKPSPKHSLDRIDNDGSYDPSNCRWATRKEQNQNTRFNRWITAFGRTQPLCEWAREVGLSATTIAERVDKKGMTAEQAIGTPRMRKVKRNLKALRENRHVS